MTQPDTIVPDPYNSQDYDRYAYVRNNPLRYTDPSGHCAMDADADDCFRPGINNPPSLADYGVTVDPKMTNNEKRAILEAVVRVGDAFAEERGLGESGVEAFVAVYDPITINTGRAGGGCETVINTITCGSFAKEGWHRLETSVINIVHELGHVFDPKVDGVWESGSYGLPQVFVDNNTTILRDNNTIQWRPNTESSKGEVFGNFFVAWVYGEWGPRADQVWPGYESYGSARNWMNTNMTNWLR